jgi:hypothetical protein
MYPASDSDFNAPTWSGPSLQQLRAAVDRMNEANEQTPARLLVRSPNARPGARTFTVQPGGFERPVAISAQDYPEYVPPAGAPAAARAGNPLLDFLGKPPTEFNGRNLITRRFHEAGPEGGYHTLVEDTQDVSPDAIARRVAGQLSPTAEQRAAAYQTYASLANALTGQVSESRAKMIGLADLDLRRQAEGRLREKDQYEMGEDKDWRRAEAAAILQGATEEDVRAARQTRERTRIRPPGPGPRPVITSGGGQNAGDNPPPTDPGAGPDPLNLPDWIRLELKNAKPDGFGEVFRQIYSRQGPEWVRANWQTLGPLLEQRFGRETVSDRGRANWFTRHVLTPYGYPDLLRDIPLGERWDRAFGRPAQQSEENALLRGLYPMR